METEYMRTGRRLQTASSCAPRESNGRAVEAEQGRSEQQVVSERRRRAGSRRAGDSESVECGRDVCMQ